MYEGGVSIAPPPLVSNEGERLAPAWAKNRKTKITKNNPPFLKRNLS